MTKTRLDPDTLSHSLADLPNVCPRCNAGLESEVHAECLRTTRGAKNDSGKLLWSLLPLDAVREIVRVLTKGAAKYQVGGWEFVESPRDRYYNALLRHVTAWYEGETHDPEWGLHHLAHACCCVLFLLSLSLRGKID